MPQQCPWNGTSQAQCHMNQPQSQTTGSASPPRPRLLQAGATAAALPAQALTFDPIFLSMSSTRTFC